MIVMLGCSETNIEISGVGMKTVESNDCREVLRNDGDANSVLATMWEGARFSCKDGQKFIDPFS